MKILILLKEESHVIDRETGHGSSVTSYSTVKHKFFLDLELLHILVYVDLSIHSPTKAKLHVLIIKLAYHYLCDEYDRWLASRLPDSTKDPSERYVMQPLD
jgi:hypothetical protein